MTAKSRYRLLSCNVFRRELLVVLGRTLNLVDPDFLELGLHEKPGALNEAVQSRIDAASEVIFPGRARYDAILLGYGLCGNGIAGVEARSLPLVIPRAHDCCTVLLGSRADFLSRFGDNLSASWSSVGCIEGGDSYFRVSEFGRTSESDLEYAQLVEKYGEENAAYARDILSQDSSETELRFIEIPETAGLGYAELMRNKALGEGRDFVLIPGSLRLLEGLVAGGWDEAEYLVVRPGERIEPVYDHERVFEAR